MFWNQYPYINLNDLNLDFLLKAIGEMQNEVENFVTLNAVKYADPIQWDITSQYEKNTIVIDPLTGTAYISVQPVPSGVALNRTDYWTPVFDLSRFITQGNENLTEHVEGAGIVYSTFALNVGDWVIWNGVLYKALVNMPIGTAYSVDGNIERVTVEEYIKDILDTIDNAVQAINDEVQARQDADGDLNDLTTNDKSNLVNALNEIAGDVNNLNIYNVLDYGAVGDGVTDDTAAIQACVDAAPSGAIVLAPKGKIYKLNSTGVNLYKACTYLMMGNFHLDAPTGACFYIDKNVAHNVNDSIIYINTVAPTAQYSIFGTTPSSIDNNGNCGVIMRYAIGCEIHIESATGFTKAGVFAECDDSVNGEAQQAGATNNQIILHNIIWFGTIMSCGAGFYARSESAERNCFQANEIHVCWMFACFHCIQLDDNNATYFASTSNLFIIAAIDNSYPSSGGGAGVMCCSYYNRFIVAYMGCDFVCNTYSGFNDIEVSNTLATDLGFIDAGCNNRFRSSMPGAVDGATHLGVTSYPRNFIVQSGEDYLNDSGTPLDLYFKCYNTNGSTDGIVDCYIGHKTSEYVQITKDYIEPAANANTKTRTIHVHVPTNWYFRFAFSNVTLDSLYWVQN